MMRGFTLLEVLIVIAVLAILSVAGVGYYRNVVQAVGAEETKRALIAVLSSARVRAMAGEGNLRFGVHAVAESPSYYELFRTPSDYADPAKEVESTTTLSAGIVFGDPASGFSKDIIFTRGGGTTSGATLILVSDTGSTTITITLAGAVY